MIHITRARLVLASPVLAPARHFTASAAARAVRAANSAPVPVKRASTGATRTAATSTGWKSTATKSTGWSRTAAKSAKSASTASTGSASTGSTATESDLSTVDSTPSNATATASDAAPDAPAPSVSKTTASKTTFSKTATVAKAAPASVPFAADNPWAQFSDVPLDEGDENGENWYRSFRGLGSQPFTPEVSNVLCSEVVPEDVEITPDGLLFLPEIKYRRILNRAFGPGGWGLAPRSQTLVTAKSVSREYALVCHGRLVAIARGEQDYFDPNGITTAMEGCKSNAMMRCCKDLGIASELWDPVFIRDFKNKFCEQKFFEKKRRMVWKRKDRDWEYPYK